MKRSIRQIAVIGTLTVGLVAGAAAHQGATGIVKERMDQMKNIAQAMKTMGAMFKGETAYDEEAVRTFAMDIAASGGATLYTLFPKDSLDHPTEARAQIWADWDRFTALSDEMQSAAIALAAGAGNRGDGNSEPRPADLFRDLAGTCKSCHEDFRIKK